MAGVVAAAGANWQTCDPRLIEALGRPIVIADNIPPHGKTVSGLIVKPGSTLAEIKPIFDLRIQDLRRKRDAAEKEADSITSYIYSQEKIEFKIAQSIGVLPRKAFPEIAARREAIFNLRDCEWIKSAQSQVEIEELTSRFKPALDAFAILQRA